ncbi:MAG: DUF262 domain-containing protein [Armatimonadota bacterium]
MALENHDQLQQEIDLSRKDMRTQGYSMSIGEWMSLFEKDEILISPEFQRYFRWTLMQKTRLIESVLLGIPIPPIYVFQRPADDRWEVIDGLQRLSTIFQFAGLMPAPKDMANGANGALRLLGTEFLPSLEGRAFEDENPEKSFNTQQRLIFKRAKLDVVIIERESSEEAKYHLFERLNTGGSQLTEQEVRNSVLSMINPPFLARLDQWSEYGPFLDTVRLSDRQLIEQYDKELLLRFLLLRHATAEDLKGMKDIGDYLMDRMRQTAENRDFDLDLEEEHFKATFDVLNDAIAGDAFRKYSADDDRFSRGFSISAYEVIAIGIGRNLLNGKPIPPPEEIIGLIKDVWKDETFLDRSGAGKRSTERIPHLIPLGERLFSR